MLAEIGSQFERTTGHRLNVYSGLPADFQRRAAAGDPFDVLVSGSSPVDRWIKEGKLDPETRTDIARSGIGVEVRAGAARQLMRFLTGATAAPVIRAQGMESAL